MRSLVTALALVVLTYPEVSDAGLSTTPAWSYGGGQASAALGQASTAGDVNGDGFSDVIVGIQGYSNGETSEGRAVLFLGSASGLGGPAWTKEINQVGATYGSWVAPAGDVNNDGYGDVMVGAPNYDNGANVDVGRMELFLGSASGLQASPAWTLTGGDPGYPICVSGSTAGDFDGDGFDDILIGEPNWRPNTGVFTHWGRAVLYYGNASGVPTVSYVFAQGADGDECGYSVAGVGDVNGDGFADVAAGCPYAEAGDAGSVKLVYGGPFGGAITLSGGAALGNLGWSVAGAGDVDGDGYADVLAGEPGYSFGDPVSEGKAHVFYGGSTPGQSTWSFHQTTFQALGQSVSTAGDVNGDGRADIVIGAPQYKVGTSFARGRAFMFQGGPAGLPSTPNWTVTGTASGLLGEVLGNSVSAAGDVNGDGYGDVLVTAPGADTTGATNEGRVRLYSGGPSPPLGYTLATNSPSGNDLLGVRMASAGDVNGDGFGDAIVARPGLDEGPSLDVGQVIVGFGNSDVLAPYFQWTAEGSDVGATFLSISVAGPGDVNGDGYDDVLAGSNESAFLWAEVAPGPGSALPIWSLPDLPNSSLQVSRAGDVNGDGYMDLLVGNARYAPDPSYVRVYHGAAAGPDTVPEFTRSGADPPSYGWTFAGAGDVNGDGYDDVLIAAPFADGLNHADVGRVDLHLGSPNGLAQNPAWSLFGDATNSELGNGAGGVGDLNGDGYGDIVLSRSPSGPWVIYGEAVIPASPSPSPLLAASGVTIATPADVNGDGFCDLVIGDKNYTAPEQGEGRVAIFLGGPGGVASTPYASIEGGVPQFGFGGSIASLDIDADGYDDLLVGQYGGGSVYKIRGNGVWGLRRRPAMARVASATTPIALLGRSDDMTRFRITGYAGSPAGRCKVRYQYEVKPQGVALDGTGLVNGAEALSYIVGSSRGSWAQLDNLVIGLSAGGRYHWRARVKTRSPYFPHSIWMSPQGNGPNERDLRMDGGTVGVAGGEASTSLRLALSGPNPASGQMAFVVFLPGHGDVDLSLYDVSGRRMETLLQGWDQGGRHELVWDGRGPKGSRVAPGVYLARLRWGSESRTLRVVML